MTPYCERHHRFFVRNGPHDYSCPGCDQEERDQQLFDDSRACSVCHEPVACNANSNVHEACYEAFVASLASE